MKPLQHARITAHRYGGKWQDWIAIHDWIDCSKAIFLSMQHRMLRVLAAIELEKGKKGLLALASELRAHGALV